MSASFWQTVAVYCNQLAPAIGPLLQATGNTAAALHNAECEARQLESDIAFFRSIAPASDEAHV